MTAAAPVNQTCYRCGVDVPSDSAHTVDRNSTELCTSCYEAAAYFCNRCCEYFYMDWNDDTDCCDRCTERYFDHCSECSEWYRSIDGHSCPCDEEYDDEYYDHSRSAAADWDNPGEYNFKPEDMRYLTGPDEPLEQSPYYFGVELELCRSRLRNEDLPRTLALNQPWCYFKHDSSIRGDGIEMVTWPFTSQWYTQLGQEQMRVWLDGLHTAGAQSGDMVGAGMHVHVSRRAFTDVAHCFRFLRLFYAHKAFTVRLSGRHSEETLRQWASLDFLPAENLLRHVVLKRALWGNHRYCAVNLANEHTIEVRVFAGTLDSALFDVNLRVVMGAVEFTRDLRKTYEATPERFARWLQTQGPLWGTTAESVAQCHAFTAGKKESYAG